MNTSKPNVVPEGTPPTNPAHKDENGATTSTEGIHKATPADNPIEPHPAARTATSKWTRNKVRLHLWFKQWRETWIPIINLGIAILAFVVIAFQSKIYNEQRQIMDRQSEFMQAQTQIMEKSFRVSERAYVGVGNVTANMETGEILIMLENIGHVPAKGVKLQGQEIRATPAENKQKGTVFRWEAGEVRLFPGTQMPVVISMQPFEQREAEAISTKKEILYIGGTIQYEDGFGNLDSTTFAFQYHPALNGRWTAHSDLSKFFKQKEH